MGILTRLAHSVRSWQRRALAARCVLVLGLAAGLAAVPGRAQALSAEYQVKAAFLFNFAQFVDWPAAAFAGPKAPVVIAILGKDPFGAYLDNLVRDEHVGERPLLIKRCSRADELTGCHLVFISGSESQQLPAILGALRERAVLTISDAEGFIRAGGMIRFALEGGRIRLRINVEAARAAHLSISSKILRPDTVATPGKD